METLIKEFPLIEEMKQKKEVLWFQPDKKEEFSDAITENDVKEAEERLERFAPYILKAYPETEESKGIIESPLYHGENITKFYKDRNGELLGDIYIKLDSELPISGSIKARGGIYEVLCVAEKVALDSGMLKITDDYSILHEDRFKELFSQYSLAVGSTGNLGLSIGIMSAKLGFRVYVHMSDDAKEWKKDLLREKGAEVIEHTGNFSVAVDKGREMALEDETCHFVDDENSKDLFLGYAVAAKRLALQIKEKDIKVNKENPLFVYLPCGVGGGPGGVAYGLKQIKN